MKERGARTIALLRMRAGRVWAQYKCSWDVLCGIKDAPFVWESPEVGGNFADEGRLREYSADHV